MAIYQLDDDIPRIADTAWVADSAQVIGRVELHERLVFRTVGRVGPRQSLVDRRQLFGLLSTEARDDHLECRGRVFATTRCAEGIAEREEKLAIVGSKRTCFLEKRGA